MYFWHSVLLLRVSKRSVPSAILIYNFAVVIGYSEENLKIHTGSHPSFPPLPSHTILPLPCLPLSLPLPSLPTLCIFTVTFYYYYIKVSLCLF